MDEIPVSWVLAVAALYWRVLAVWASDGVDAVVLVGESVRAFTVVPKRDGYQMMKVTEP